MTTVNNLSMKNMKSSNISRRDFLKCAASLGAMPLLSSCGAKNKSISGDSNPIFRENEMKFFTGYRKAKAGTPVD